MKQAIVQNIVTEKSSHQQSTGKYSFMVKKDATKIEIKQAVKEIYGADVSSVRTLISPKKIRILKGKYEWNKRPAFKKAIVTLKGKQTIDPNKIKEQKKEPKEAKEPKK